MKALCGLLITVLLSSSSFAISRVINCQGTQNTDEYVTLVLQKGHAYAVVCEGAPCQYETTADMTATLDGTAADGSLQYRVLSGDKPAHNEFTVSFDQGVDVSFDGDRTQYFCY